MSKLNGGIIGPDNVPTGAFGSASGVWSLSDVTNYKKQGTWPVLLSGHQVANSCRFNSASSDTLSRTFGTSTSQKIFTWSLWYKKTKNATNMYIFENTGNASSQGSFVIGNDDKIVIYDQTNGSLVGTSTVLRDPSAWYHIVVRLDTTQSTASDRVRIYINNVQQTLGGTQPSQNTDYPELSSSGSVGTIGKYDNNNNYLDGYLCEVVFCDGQSLAPTSFGETDSVTNNWVPKVITGLTFGNNGFYLDFKDSSALGNDAAGSNNFTANNLTSIDQSVDTCTNNFATGNPLAYTSTLSEGNLKLTGSSSYETMLSTIAVDSGKWYAEAKVDNHSSVTLVGIIENEQWTTRASGYHITGDQSLSFAYANDGRLVNAGDTNNWGSTYTTGDIIGIAIDLTNNKLYFSKNGTWQNSADPAAGSNGVTIADKLFHFAITNRTSDFTSFNFGSPPYAISSGNTDSSGMGNFEYAVPSGYYSLCTRNLNLIG